MSLPALPVDAILPDLPDMIGISAKERAYGNETPVRAAISRERSKAARDLIGHQQLRSFSDDALGLAEYFSDDAPALSDALIQDSAGARYLAAGELPALQVSTLTDSGKIGRESVSDPATLPPDALVRRARSFQVNDAAFKAGLSGFRSGLKPDAPHREQRLDAAAVAERTEVSAESQFRAGHVKTAEVMLGLATGVLQAATIFVPELSVARSAYELVSGRDLFTGRRLSSVELGLCALNIATIGAASTVEQLTTAMRAVRIGEETPPAIETAIDALDHHFPEPVTDDLLQSTKTGIIETEGGGLIKTQTGGSLGSPLPSDNTYARVLPRDAAEKLAAGDPAVRLAPPNEDNLVAVGPDLVKHQFAFISAAEDLRGFTRREELTNALARFKNGAVESVRDDEVIMEFQFTRADSPQSLLNPIGEKWGPAFIPGGRTAKGIREWVVPNTSVQDGLIDITSIKLRPVPRP
jgi:hypothetical protein